LSLYIMLHRSEVVGVLIGIVRQSRPVLGASPYHFVVTGAFRPYHDDILPHPFARMGK
jgi:hypothetical protein